MDANCRSTFEPLVSVQAALHDGRIVLDRPLQELRDAIEGGSLLRVSGLCSAERALAWRQSLAGWVRSVPPFQQGRSAADSVTSFHRYDDDHPQSRVPHRFVQIALNMANLDDAALREQSAAALGPMLEVQNQLGDTSTVFDDPRFRVKAVNHVRGGGYMVRHSHPRELLPTASFMALSRPGVDYTSGDAVFVAGTPRRDFCLGEALQPGAAFFFRYDLPHELTPVDPAAVADPHADSGLWAAMFEPIGAYERTFVSN